MSFPQHGQQLVCFWEPYYGFLLELTHKNLPSQFGQFPGIWGCYPKGKLLCPFQSAARMQNAQINLSLLHLCLMDKIALYLYQTCVHKTFDFYVYLFSFVILFITFFLLLGLSYCVIGIYS